MRRLRLRLSSLGDAGDPPRLRGGAARAPARAPRGRALRRRARALDANPLRAFDSDHAGTRAVMADAPRLLDRLTPEDAEHFAEVRALLDDAGQPYEVDPTLVRGPRLLHAHGVRVHERRPRRPERRRRRRPLRRAGRGARRAADAGGRLGGRGRADPAGAASGAEAATTHGVSAAGVRGGRRKPEASRRTAFALVRELRDAGLRARDGAGRALAEGPAQARRPARRPRRCHRRRRASRSATWRAASSASRGQRRGGRRDGVPGR